MEELESGEVEYESAEEFLTSLKKEFVMERFGPNILFFLLSIFLLIFFFFFFFFFSRTMKKACDITVT